MRIGRNVMADDLGEAAARRKRRGLKPRRTLLGSPPVHPPDSFMRDDTSDNRAGDDPFGFDTAPTLWGAHTDKFDNVSVAFGVTGRDILPMWVADMDFAAAPAIREAMRAEAERGYFGYWGDTAPVSEAVAGWLHRRHGWTIDPGHVRYTHGVVAGFATTLEAFSAPGEAIIVFSPVYHSFYGKARAMGREIVESPLVLEGGQFRMDLDTLQAKLSGRERVVTLCSPHNPGGRLWTGDEIRDLAAFCARNDLLLISDEIHMDLVFPGHAHMPTAVAAPEALDRLVVLTAASKGFNTAGGETGQVIIPDDALRARYDQAHRSRGGTPNRFGMLMTKAAFTHGDDWSAAVRAYLAGNFALWRDGISALPGVSVMEMTSTYLSWVDFTGTGMADDEVGRRVLSDARIAASAGKVFGTGGEGHMRFNLGTSRGRIREAVDRMQAAFADLQ
jgi:cystathionine beta-lyase